MYIVQCLPLFHLPLAELWSDQYSLSCYRKPANFAENIVLCHSDSTNIRPIANLKTGGARVATIAHTTYRSCHGMIKTEILNWREILMDLKIEPQYRNTVAKQPQVYVRSG
jgi:hypothetical protein